MDHKFCECVRNNWDKYVTFCQKKLQKVWHFILSECIECIRTWPKLLDVMLTFDKSQKSHFLALFECKVK